MKNYILYSMILSLSTILLLRAETPEGFYKVLFSDGGVGLNSVNTLPAADYLNYSWEFIAHNTINLQNEAMIKNEYDDNGVLLYPDGEPRFQILYTNGGYSAEHGTSLGEEGRERVRTFYYRGGSYSGSCGGAYISTVDSNVYYKIWPGSITGCGVHYSLVGGDIPADSPLLNYYDYGNDNYIENIVHHYGGYGSVIPPGTEILLIHDKPETGLDDQPSCWAYKDNDTTGRIAVMTSHPENEWDGELRDFMAAVLQYALDGLAPPSTKGPLAKGVKRIMNKSTKDEDPINTKIGDKQYHHFIIDLPEGATNLVLTVDGDDVFDLNLYVNKDTFAFASLADFADTSDGADKAISIDTAAPGIWYVGVECATTVVAEKINFGYHYSGQLEVLNGVEYTIEADWGNTGIIASNKGLYNTNVISITTKSNAVFITVTNSEPYSLAVHDVKGRLCRASKTTLGINKFTWEPSSPGMYIVRLKSGNDIVTRRVTFMR